MYLLGPVTIKFQGEKHSVEVTFSPHLTPPPSLDTNWPGFQTLVRGNINE